MPPETGPNRVVTTRPLHASSSNPEGCAKIMASFRKWPWWSRTEDDRRQVAGIPRIPVCLVPCNAFPWKASLVAGTPPPCGWVSTRVFKEQEMRPRAELAWRDEPEVAPLGELWSRRLKRKAVAGLSGWKARNLAAAWHDSSRSSRRMRASKSGAVLLADPDPFPLGLPAQGGFSSLKARSVCSSSGTFDSTTSQTMSSSTR